MIHNTNTSTFISTFAMRADVTVHENGNVTVTPAELPEPFIHDAFATTIKGRMEVCDDGYMDFLPYKTGTGSRYTDLFSTDFSEVKATKNDVLFQIRLPKKMDKYKILEYIHAETALIENWISTLTTNTIYK